MALIETAGLTKRYPGVIALEDLTIAIEGGIVGLVGANGAGKSTLIKLLLGLVEPTHGTASVLGYDIIRERAELRRFVGYMPEHECLPPDVSATEFVTHMARLSGLPRSAARERTADVLRQVGLFEERYRPIGTYSTGMRQRAKLAQALVHDPQLLFLDEPTNGLDPEGREEMLDLIRRTGKEFGIAILMASHLLGEIERVCDSLVVLDAGRLVEAGPLHSFTSATGRLIVEFDGDRDAAAAALRARGLGVASDGSAAFLIEPADDLALDAIRDVAAELGLGLVRLEPARRQLEDLFRRSSEPSSEAVHV